MEILVVKEKNSTYYDVSDGKRFYNTCCKILKERLDKGWYGNYEEIKDELGMSEKVINAFPEWAKMDYYLKKPEYKREKVFINKVKKCLATKYDSNGKTAIKSYPYSLLRSRKDYEYEWVGVEEVINIDGE